MSLARTHINEEHTRRQKLPKTPLDPRQRLCGLARSLKDLDVLSVKHEDRPHLRATPHLLAHDGEAPNKVLAHVYGIFHLAREHVADLGSYRHTRTSHNTSMHTIREGCQALD